MKEKEVVKKDYRLVNAGYKLTLQEIKLILTVISKLEKNKYSYVFDIKEFSFLSDAKNHKVLNNIKHNLLRKPIRIIEKDGGEIVCNWFSGFYYRDGKLECSIYHRLIPYLFDLKERFVMYQLENVLKLRSVYSIRIYELLKEYEKIQEREFELEELYFLLSVPRTYKTYAIFKVKVLQQALEEINSKTDLYISLTEKKIGRQVYKVIFHITQKSENNKKQDFINSIRAEVEDILGVEFAGYKDEIFEIIQKNYHLSKDVILSNLLLTVSSNCENIAAYFTTALKNDYGKKMRQKLESLKKEEEQKEEERQKMIKEQEEREERIKREKELVDIFANLPDEIKQEYINRVKADNKKLSDSLATIIAASLFYKENVSRV